MLFMWVLCVVTGFLETWIADECACEALWVNVGCIKISYINNIDLIVIDKKVLDQSVLLCFTGIYFTRPNPDVNHTISWVNTYNTLSFLTDQSNIFNLELISLNAIKLWPPTYWQFVFCWP